MHPAAQLRCCHCCEGTFALLLGLELLADDGGVFGVQLAAVTEISGGEAQECHGSEHRQQHQARYSQEPEGGAGEALHMRAASIRRSCSWTTDRKSSVAPPSGCWACRAFCRDSESLGSMAWSMRR